MTSIVFYDDGLSTIITATGKPGSAVGLITGTLLPGTTKGCLIDTVSVNATSRYSVNYSLSRVPYFYLFGANLVNVTIAGRIFRHVCTGSTLAPGNGLANFYNTMESTAPWNYYYWQVNFPDESGKIFRGLLVAHNTTNSSAGGLLTVFNVTLIGFFIA